MTIKKTDSEFKDEKIFRFIEEITPMEQKTDMESSFSLTNVCIKATSEIMSLRELGRFIGETEGSIWENGKNL